jgi:hypothetical protein
MRIDESQASSTIASKLGFIKRMTSAFFRPCFHEPPGRRRLRFSFFHPQCQRAGRFNPSLQSRQNATGPPYLAPDVQSARSWKRV